MRNGLARIAVAAGACLAAPASAAPPALVGYYQTLHYYVSAAVKGAGSCAETAGTYATSVIYYPGPGKPGTTDWQAINQKGFVGEFVSSFGVQPAAGVNTWSGTYTIRLLPTATVTHASFHTTVTPLDARSSTATSTYSYPVTGGGTCTVMEQNSYIFTGH